MSYYKTLLAYMYIDMYNFINLWAFIEFNQQKNGGYNLSPNFWDTFFEPAMDGERRGDALWYHNLCGQEQHFYEPNLT